MALITLNALHDRLNPFDMFLASALEMVIKDELGLRTYKKIEKRIYEKYNLNMFDAIKNFSEIDTVLREDFGKGADKIEKKFLEHILGITKENNNLWITIYDPKLTSMILESFGDPEKKKILEHSFQQPSSIMSVLDSCTLSKTSGYRWANELIKNGLLVETSFEITKEGKKIGKYTSLFNEVKIHIGKDLLHVQVLMNPNFLKTSNIFNVLKTLR